MKRLTGRASAIILLAAWLFSNSAAASHPDILRNYRFIPSRSTLDVTGGFAGIDETFHAFGKFGLVTGYEEGVSCTALGCFPTHVPFAEFVDVEAWLVPESPLAFVWDLDQTLNLTGLDGTFQFGEPNRLFFRGEDGQGQPIWLRAMLRGPLIRIVGENDPVNGPGGSVCSDCFGYKIDFLAHLAPYSDFNLDGFVDLHDLDSLMDHIGMRDGATFEQGDADGDGDIDGDDLLAWQRQVGTSVNLSEFDEVGVGSSGVPEPAAAVLLVLATMMLAVSYRRRRLSC